MIGANELSSGMNEVFRNNIRRVVEDGDYSRFEDTVIESETTGGHPRGHRDEQRGALPAQHHAMGPEPPGTGAGSPACSGHRDDARPS